MIIPIYFDTETTGLSSLSDRIIEIAALNAHTGESFVRLINPGRSIPAEASAIHKISDAMVQSAPSFDVVGQEFLQFCAPKEAGHQIALIAHNSIGFDVPFLRNELQRNKLAMPQEWIFLDTLFWARHYRPDLPKHALQYLRQIYGIQANTAHRALDDVIILKEVFEAMIDDLPWDWVCAKLLQIQPKPK